MAETVLNGNVCAIHLHITEPLKFGFSHLICSSSQWTVSTSDVCFVWTESICFLPPLPYAFTTVLWPCILSGSATRQKSCKKPASLSNWNRQTRNNLYCVKPLQFGGLPVVLAFSCLSCPEMYLRLWLFLWV